MGYASEGRDDWKAGDQAKPLDAYRECAVRIVRGTEDWKTSFIPYFAQLDGSSPLKLRNGLPPFPAAVVAVELLPELEPEQQLKSVVQLFRSIYGYGPSEFRRSIEKVGKWLDELSNRKQAYEILKHGHGDDWQGLMVGLLQSGLGDDAVLKILKTRFVEDSINRLTLLSGLLHSLDYEPDLAQLVIDLIKHPVLDATTEDPSPPRVLFLNNAIFSSIPERHRSKFRPLFQELAESGRKHEAGRARSILNEWK